MFLESIVNIQNLFYLFLIIVFIAYWVLVFTIFYHLTRFGIGTFPKKIATIFLLGSVLFFCVSFLFITIMSLDTLKDLIGNLVNGIYNNKIID